MANSTSLSLSESSVYRNIYRSSGPTGPMYKSVTDSPRPDRRGDPSSNNDKWTFLQKLLAIEEAHDRKRMEREKLYGSSELFGGRKPEDLTDKKSIHRGDALSRWLHGQVLDDENEDSQIDEDVQELSPLQDESLRETNTHRCQINSNVPKLPAVIERTGHSEGDTMSVLRNSEDISTSTQTISISPGHLSRFPSIQEDDGAIYKPRRKRQLRLPPILLPKVYTVTPRPLQYREFLTPTKIRGPITDEEWEDLKDCRYIRHAVPRFALQVSSSNMSSMQF